MAEKDIKRVDWEAVEREYRAGQFTLDEIAATYGISKGRISQVAKREGWSRNLAYRIAAKAAATLQEAAITEVRLNEAREIRLNDPAKRLTDKERVDAGAAAIVERIQSHRSEILETRQALKDLRDELRTADAKQMPIPTRIDCLRKIAETAKTLIALERQAYSIADTVEPEEATTITANPREIARRIAHALSIGLRSVEAPPIPGTPQQQQWAH